jgi:hypothetical protein
MEDSVMKSASCLGLAAALLLAGVSLAAANTMSRHSSTTGSAFSSVQPAAKDRLSLSSKQRQMAWKDISNLAAKEKVPSGFTAKVGEEVPSALRTYPVPVTTANRVPTLRPYQYAMLKNNKLLIVNPKDKKIAEIITQ